MQTSFYPACSPLIALVDPLNVFFYQDMDTGKVFCNTATLAHSAARKQLLNDKSKYRLYIMA